MVGQRCRSDAWAWTLFRQACHACEEADLRIVAGHESEFTSKNAPIIERRPHPCAAPGSLTRQLEWFNIFDATIVALSLLDVAFLLVNQDASQFSVLRGFRVIRILRVLRVARTLKLFASLRVLVSLALDWRSEGWVRERR